MAEISCSFCEKSRGDDGPVVESKGGVRICRQCAVLCLDVLEQAQQRRAGESLQESTDVACGKNVAELIRDLRMCDDQTLEVRMSFGGGENSYPIALVGIGYGPCLLLQFPGRRQQAGPAD